MDKAEPETKNSIAVISMACVYPGAGSPEELWENVLAGRRYFRKTPPERIPGDYFDPDPDAPEKTYSDQMAVITDWKFNPVEFKVPPVVAQVSDITHWLALSTVKAALEGAGAAPCSMDPARVGVILGNSMAGEFSRSLVLRFRWPYVRRAFAGAARRLHIPEDTAARILAEMEHFYQSPLPRVTEDTLAGNMSNTIAGRICGHFNFGGGGFTIDGACSSSLLAVAHSCEALLNRQLDMVVTGGVDVSLDPFEVVGFAKARALAAANDDIRPYDRRAAGMLPGEGCGIVLLMREEDAREKGCPIHALIKGWGYSSDGKGSITAPEPKGQMRAMQNAYRRAGYPISLVTLIEGHGTGTKLGDKVEIEALRAMLDESPGDELCWLGSIKGNIGHCKAAAGMAGFIKSVMALKRKIIPPTASCGEPNPAFGAPLGRLRPTVRGTVWPKRKTPRRASVSAYGFGGSNAHVALEESGPDQPPCPEDLAKLGSDRKTELVLLAGDSPDSLRREIEKLAPLAGRLCRAELTDLAAALAKKIEKKKFRAAVIAESPWQLAQRLADLIGKLSARPEMDGLDDPETGIYAGAAKDGPKMAALFPGQGSQYLNMGQYLFSHYPFIKDFYLEAERAAGEMLPRGLRPYIFINTLSCRGGIDSFTENRLRETQIAQPAIVLSSMAAFSMLEFFGLEPDLMIGHSLGQVTALYAAGVFDELTAVRVAALRGRAMGSLECEDQGAMLAVNESAEKVKKMIRPFAGALSVSNYNSPRQTVVSGERGAILELMAGCEREHVRCKALPVSHAFHSRFVAPAAEIFRHAIDSIHFDAISGRVISTMTGEEIGADDDLKTLLSDHIRKPVRFSDAVYRAAEEEPDLWVETGPGAVLTGLVRDMLGGRADCFVTDSEKEDGSQLWNRLLARAFVLGFPVRTDRLFAHRFHRPFDPGNYAPRLIVDPCERPVEDPCGLAVPEGARELPSGLMPEIPSGQLQDYLKERGGFIREFIALDFDHFNKSHGGHFAKTRMAPEKTPDSPIKPAASESTPAKNGQIAHLDGEAGRQDVLEFARQWVSRRTGFPVSEVHPDKKLRDDLNLDSIKTGELVITLGRRFGVQFTGDPAANANASLSMLMDSMRFRGETGPRTGASGPEGKALPPGNGLADTIRVFAMRPIADPLAGEDEYPLPRNSAVLILAEPGSSQAEAAALELERKGLRPLPCDISRGELPPLVKTSAVIIFLPRQGRERGREKEKAFFECSPGEFTSRVEGLASMLFHIFRRALENRGGPLRFCVVRHYGETGNEMDMDGGAGFLKTLSIEYPDVQFKWLRLPETWPAQKCADTIAKELELMSPRVVYEYRQDGWRGSVAACPLEEEESPAQGHVLGPDDVLLATGGAKGITFELALGMARASGARLALLGSSPKETGEITGNLERLKEEAIPHLYVQCDVTDTETVSGAVRAIEKELGPVTGILHGAGTSKPGLFGRMDPDEFLRAIRIKAFGLYNVLGAVSRQRLRALHVISSILGKTGMRGQADYTFANAWLDCALARFARSFPAVQCISLGYSIWSETGLGKKLGAVETLSALGVSGIATAGGVALYLKLAERGAGDTVFAITGRLTPELEANLFPPYPGPRARFLERIIRYIPRGEVVAEAAISHERDLYLREHVFRGTTVFPGVMAMEAICEAAMACAGRDALPVLRGLKFHRPLIVPEGQQVRLLIQAVAAEDGESAPRVKVKVIIRSDTDGFKEDHFSAECVFTGEADATDLPGFPVPLPRKLRLDPEGFSPEPLFQGKFFRRITSVRLLDASESITDVGVPAEERYFAGIEAPLFTSSPAARDACLQSGALLLPGGYLPVGIEEVRFYEKGKIAPGSTVVCRVVVRKYEEGAQNGGGEYKADISVFSADGTLIETIRGILMARASGGQDGASRRAIKISALEDGFRSVLRGAPYSLSILDGPSGPGAAAVKTPFSNEDRAGRGKKRAETEDAPQWALICTRRAAEVFFRDFGGGEISSLDIGISHRPDGKPELEYGNADGGPGRIDVSLSDSEGRILALVGPAPVGVDIEAVEQRGADMWRGLLGEDGYALAGRLCGSPEDFDPCATIVWTLLEAGMKANGLKRTLPEFRSGLLPPWLSFEGRINGAPVTFLSALVEDGAGRMFAFSAAVNAGLEEPRLSSGGKAEIKITENRPSSGNSAEKEMDDVMSGFLEAIKRFTPLCLSDPDDGAAAEARHLQFERTVNSTLQTLESFKAAIPADRILQKQLWLQKAVLGLAGGAVAFRRASEKPLGYPGDFLLLDMMFQNRNIARGIGYHYDRNFLSFSGSEAVRRRTFWAVHGIEALRAERRLEEISVLDLGCGPVSMERVLAGRAPAGFLHRFTGIDFDARALEFAKAHLTAPDVEFTGIRKNLLTNDGLREIEKQAAGADACACMGLIEYLEKDAVLSILESLFRGARAGTRMFTGNYVPGHGSRASMEWLFDWRLVYRTEDGMRALALEAGFAEGKIDTRLDPTGSIVLMMLEK